MAPPVSVAGGSSISCRLVLYLSFVALVFVVSSCGVSSICRSCCSSHDGTICCHFLWLQSSCGSSRPVSPGSSISFVVCGAGICRSWLWYLLLLLPVSSICCSSLQYWLCRSWPQYLSFVSPISSVVRGSCGCCSSLQPVSVVRGFSISPVVCGSSICCSCGGSSGISCRSWLHQYLSPVAPLVVACGSGISCRS